VEHISKIMDKKGRVEATSRKQAGSV